jgi:hypothetical protein
MSFAYTIPIGLSLELKKFVVKFDLKEEKKSVV